MDLRQLEYFAAVARHRHFRRAAEDLYVTQSAVSQQVRRLEAELGVALLRRNPGSHPPVDVTPAGEELLARAEAILADVAGARAAMDQHAGTLRGGVRA
ncbi:MAG: LysR family transcriptional regulator, partial [Conexibacter sp.]|nr:LysR family transcriptional regulator [Conexibacter sp.]